MKLLSLWPLQTYNYCQKTLAHEIQKHQKLWEESRKSEEKIRLAKEIEGQRSSISGDRNTTLSINNSRHNPDPVNTTSAATASISFTPTAKGSSSSSLGRESNHLESPTSASVPPVALVDRLNATIRGHEGQIAVLRHQLSIAHKLRGT